MGWRVRSYGIAAAAAAYVAFAALRRTEGSALSTALLVGLPIALAWAWSATASNERGGEPKDLMARGGARTAFAGAAIVLAAISGGDAPAFVAAANFGAALASTGALIAFARAYGLGGLVEPAASARRLDAAVFGLLLWTVAVALPAGKAFAEARTSALDPLFVDYATVAASLTSIGTMLVTTLIVRVRRRLELGLADRASAAFWLAFTVLLASVGAAATGVARPERLLPFACAVASVAVAISAVAKEADALARALRVVLALAALVVPIALYAAYVARVAARYAASTVAFACAIAAIAGVIAPIVGRRFLSPGGGKWLVALDAATRAAMTPDPDVALERALLALRGAAGQRGRDPSLYYLGVPEVVTVDRAGYLHRETGEPPPRLVELASDEPERVLRLEALRAAEVRRPDVRPLSAWLEERGFSAIAVVRDDFEPVGLLAIPAGTRSRPWTLEEARALRALSDRLGAVIGATAQLSRSRQREVELRAELGRARAEAESLTRGAARDSERRESAAKLLARPAEVAAYSPAARTATDQLERLAATGRPIALLSAPGVDAVAWAAIAHLASPRRTGPLAIVDGANALEHDVGRWRDPVDSPLAAATGGSLVIVDAHALPIPVQTYLAAAIGDGAGLVVSLRATVDALVASGSLGEHLADKLGDRAVALPTLASRAEDLRALALETLARIGVRLHSRPLGLDTQALAALLEHDWPGNDAELHATLLRAALVADGDVIGLSELAASGFAKAAVVSVRPSAFPAAKRTRGRG